MKILNKLTGVAAIVATITMLTGCANLKDDGADAKVSRIDNLNQVRYLEIFVVGGNGITGNLRANVYNTSLIPGFDGATTKDSAPQEYVEGLSTEQIKKQFGALGVALNGPKLWMIDWFELPLGKDEDFNGREIPWCATLHLTKSQLKTMGKVGYQTTTIERTSKLGYNKGTTVYLIDDAEGNTWIMKGFEIGMNPKWTFQEFAADPASHFQHLPPGWKFRTKVLDQDLILIPETGVATIMPDEFYNVYDKTGPGYSNYKP
ncbi:MAG TPA: hypothetical protein VMJ12_11390 [Candidatus Acidoferrales bacterium]|nr:hypothetical protein [Candidatus Acidoferrales bacterium]